VNLAAATAWERHRIGTIAVLTGLPAMPSVGAAPIAESTGNHMSTIATRRLSVIAGLALGIGSIVTTQPPAGAAVASQPAWTRLGPTFGSFDQAGMLRLASGRLHLIWQERQSNGNYSYHTATISATGHLLGTGTALSNWANLEGDPRLVSDGPAIRLVFIGSRTNNASDFYSRGAVYTAVSNGSSWTLVAASMAQHTVLNLGLAAVTRSDKTPVAAFGLNNILYFHEGLDASAPAVGADGAVTGPGGTGLLGVALARGKDGSIWMAWYQKFGSSPGYYVQRILPTAGPLLKAPGSGTSTGADNEPLQQVAFVARPHGGLFLAYCAPTKIRQCTHVDLWRVGSSRAMIVPRSNSGSAGLVALSAAPTGRLWVAWLDPSAHVVHTALTNSAASRIGSVRAFDWPKPTILLDGLQADGSAVRLDLVADILVAKPASHYELWHVQVP
jgi:hypothetical protein